MICQEKPKGYSCPNDPGWSMIDGRCFYISNGILKWKRAKKKCISMNARLFEPKNSHANTIISKVFGKDEYWIGINDKREKKKK